MFTWNVVILDSPKPILIKVIFAAFVLFAQAELTLDSLYS